MSLYFDDSLDITLSSSRFMDSGCGGGELTSLPTPPDSNDGSPLDDSSQVKIHISTMFYPGSPIDGAAHGESSDLVLISSGSNPVFFYVHSSKLLQGSSNHFGGLLSSFALTSPLPSNKALGRNTSSFAISPPPESPQILSSNPLKTHSSPNSNFNDIEIHPSSISADIPDAKLLPLPESSEVLNAMLHTIYDLDCSHYAPSFETLSGCVKSLISYGFDIAELVQYKRPLYMHILSHAPSRPLDVYALAAFHQLEGLAIASSSHLLSFQLPNLTDEACMMIGPVYLKRLFFLHLGRIDALKRLLTTPPHPHPPTGDCDFVEQKKLTRAWSLATGYLLCEARPDTSVGILEGALLPLGDHMWCEECRRTLRERVRDLTIQWSVIKTTI